jgi:hypothetical protein
MQAGNAALGAFLLQAAMQVFSSLLQRMAAACVGPVPSTANSETAAMNSPKGMKASCAALPPVESQGA